MAHQNSRPLGWLSERSVAFWTVVAGVVAVITLIITFATLAQRGTSTNSAAGSSTSTENPSKFITSFE
jgi:hypothetical protein